MNFLGNYTFKKILPTIFILIFTICSFAQDTVDVVDFKSGNSIKGKIIELSDDTINIETRKDNVFF